MYKLVENQWFSSMLGNQMISDILLAICYSSEFRWSALGFGRNSERAQELLAIPDTSESRKCFIINEIRY